MKTQRNRIRSTEHGVSLIEVMIGISIGAVILVLVVNIFQSQRTSYQTQEATSRLQENARFIMEFLSRDIRMAGRPNINNGMEISVPNAFPPLVVVGSVQTGNFDGSARTGGNTRTSDQLEIAYYPAAGNIAQDCLGSVPNAPVTFVRNRYYIAAPSDNPNIRSLFCQGNGTDGAQPGAELARGIDFMQVQYGINTDENEDPPRANVYVSANSLNNATYPWSDIVSVRISLIANSQTDNPVYNGTSTAQLLQLLDAPTYTTTDTAQFPVPNLLRRVFTTTIMLRN